MEVENMFNSRKFRMGILSLLGVACLFNCACAYPSDPPINDDYNGIGHLSHTMYRRNGEVQFGLNSAVTIYWNNPNFNFSHAHTGNNRKINHTHFYQDYGAYFYSDYYVPGVITPQEGDAYWDWTFRGFNPTPTKITMRNGNHATVKTDCISYAFNGYQSGAVAAYWVDSLPGDYYAQGYVNELYPRHYPGDNGDKNVASGDRCYASGAHAWVINEVARCGNPIATKMRFKYSASAIYEWSPSSPCNDAPASNDDGQSVFLTTYGVYLKYPY